MGVMIKLVDVSLAFGRKQVLQNLSFEIKEEESVLLAGRSGCGKTTVFKLILGLMKPDSGEIYVMDQNIHEISGEALNKIRRHVGFVFQNNALFDSLTVADNVAFFLVENLKLPKEEVYGKVKETLRKLEMENTIHNYPDELSGGMKKRVAIARAMVTSPQLLLYDEPVQGLDPLSAARVVELINYLQEEHNHTAVVVSHNIYHFENTVERLLLLENGKISYDGAYDSSIFEQVK